MRRKGRKNTNIKTEKRIPDERSDIKNRE